MSQSMNVRRCSGGKPDSSSHGGTLYDSSRRLLASGSLREGSGEGARFIWQANDLVILFLMWGFLLFFVVSAAASYCNPIDGPRIDGRWCFLSTSIYCRGGVDYSVNSCLLGCSNGYCIREFDCASGMMLLDDADPRIHRDCRHIHGENISVPSSFSFEDAAYDVDQNMRIYAGTLMSATMNSSSECVKNLIWAICERAYFRCGVAGSVCGGNAFVARNACPRLYGEMNFASFCAARPVVAPSPMPLVVMIAIGIVCAVIVTAIILAITLLTWAWWREHAAMPPPLQLQFPDMTMSAASTAQGQ